jgi:GntR family transcriptional repressor for pyruvate dehydrogenase complex
MKHKPSDLEMDFNTVGKTRASDQVRSQIMAMLQNGRLQVGDQLPPEGALARRMGVSQVPVREAVKSLEHIGLLTVKRGSGGGVFVSEPSLEPFSRFFTLLLSMGKASVQEITEARLMVEPGVAALAAQHAEAGQLEALRKAHQEYEAAVRQDKPRKVSDMEFHVILAEASRNKVLEMLLKALVPLLFRTAQDHEFDQANRLRGIREHQAVLRAVESRDPAAAEKAMAEHIRRMATYWK